MTFNSFLMLAVISFDGHYKTKPSTLYDKRDEFNFAIVNFPFLCNNIPLSPAYPVYISYLIQNT
jgi:hypothetical protein